MSIATTLQRIKCHAAHLPVREHPDERRDVVRDPLRRGRVEHGAVVHDLEHVAVAERLGDLDDQRVRLVHAHPGLGHDEPPVAAVGVVPGRRLERLRQEQHPVAVLAARQARGAVDVVEPDEAVLRHGPEVVLQVRQEPAHRLLRADGRPEGQEVGQRAVDGLGVRQRHVAAAEEVVEADVGRARRRRQPEGEGALEDDAGRHAEPAGRLVDVGRVDFPPQAARDLGRGQRGEVSAVEALVEGPRPAILNLQKSRDAVLSSWKTCWVKSRNGTGGGGTVSPRRMEPKWSSKTRNRVPSYTAWSILMTRSHEESACVMTAYLMKERPNSNRVCQKSSIKSEASSSDSRAILVRFSWELRRTTPTQSSSVGEEEEAEEEEEEEEALIHVVRRMSLTSVRRVVASTQVSGSTSSGVIRRTVCSAHICESRLPCFRNSDWPGGHGYAREINPLSWTAVLTVSGTSKTLLATDFPTSSVLRAAAMSFSLGDFRMSSTVSEYPTRRSWPVRLMAEMESPPRVKKLASRPMVPVETPKMSAQTSSSVSSAGVCTGTTSCSSPEEGVSRAHCAKYSRPSASTVFLRAFRSTFRDGSLGNVFMGMTNLGIMYRGHGGPEGRRVLDAAAAGPDDDVIIVIAIVVEGGGGGDGLVKDAQGDEVRLVVDVGDHGHRVPDETGAADGVLDLAELDAVAVDLDLVVLAAQALDLASGQPPGQVARPVDARPEVLALDVGRVRQVGPVHVALGDLRSGDAELADGAVGDQGLAVRTGDEGHDGRERRADVADAAKMTTSMNTSTSTAVAAVLGIRRRRRRRQRRRPLDILRRHHHGGLGRPVDIQDLAVRPPGLDDIRRQGLSADDEGLEARHVGGAEELGHGRGDDGLPGVHAVDAAGDVGQQRLRRGHAERAARAERVEEVLHRGVEDVVGELQRAPGAAVPALDLRHARHRRRRRSVRDLDALGHAGAAGRVDQVGEGVWRYHHLLPLLLADADEDRRRVPVVVAVSRGRRYRLLVVVVARHDQSLDAVEVPDV
ncbi:hypothetical protein ColKHC_09110 [Colletotrichum higginsianum]|nr:hypothetical protein ColKHC_09110 [Colletotrichum higginsianum]